MPQNQPSTSQVARLTRPHTEPRMPLDEKIADAERSLASLRRIKNSHVAVSRIPVEILGYIFSFYKKHPPAWVAITHVCHLWREVALSSPLLWSDIVTYNLPWMEETLARSRAVPISLSMRIQPGTLANVIPSVITHTLPHITRVKEIVIHGTAISSYVQPLLECEIPKLEVLELCETWAHFSIGDRIPFGGQKPLQLRSLRLQKCSFMWPTPLFLSSTLTELKISHMLPKDRPGLPEICEVLATLPKLKTLVLFDVICTSPSSTGVVDMSADASKVSLPYLKSLSFASSKATDIAAFLSRLSVPTSSSLHLACRTLDMSNMYTHDGHTYQHDPSPAASGSSSLMLSVTKFFGLDSRTAVGVGHDVTDGYHSVGVVEWREREQEWCLLAGKHPCDIRASALQSTAGQKRRWEDYFPLWRARFFLALPGKEDHDRNHHVKSILQDACLLLPLSKVDTVIVSCDLYYDPVLWWRTFGRMKHVKAVVVAGRALCGFAAALGGKGRPIRKVTSAIREQCPAIKIVIALCCSDSKLALP
ncbi:hypothetical protein BV25DRAFT_1842781 [Artomyces pyxidatus]|uniref:Uncharacterized protein n=1 Tax=Artomyces pyxidatus TaxID=48021 RepID=A0ACB8SIN2_9AGAM|nr:hypothetical protein BV25DRAFT_1842781 [Artomyces pyxidatus]